MVYQINICKKAIELSLGIIPEKPPQKLINYCVQSNRFFIFKPGEIKKISIPKKTQLPKYVKYFEFQAKKGDKIQTIKNHTQRLGSVMVFGKTRQEAIKRVKKIKEKVKIEFKVV